MRIAPLRYEQDSARLFRAVAGLPWAVWLDSGAPGASGRYDVVAADPFVTLRTRGSVTHVEPRGGRARASAAPPLELLREQLGERAAAEPRLPFSGGAVGYFGYDLGRRFERLPVIAEADIAMPELAVGVYDWAVVVDHRERRTCLVGRGRDPATFAGWEALCARLQGEPPAPPAPFRVVSAIVSDFTQAEYAAAFRRVQEHIRRGDCYQVNLTQRFSAAADGDPWHAYLKLRRLNPAPFSAYLDLPDGQVLCSSPERFLKLTGGHVETKPIKGTRPRAADPARDAELAAALRASAKDRAENVMIVDLLRNDLGKCCIAGSVRATKLFDVETFASVHHLVSTVEGRLAPDRDALHLLEACFPGGSITGAPKLRAMEVIESLEPHRRSVYCGAIGYIGFDGDMDLNIAIRTILHYRRRVYAWAGGGVVADSQVEAEYQESFDKAAALLAVLQGRADGLVAE
jgi:para-aminobenzoate synthetase component 1